MAQSQPTLSIITGVTSGFGAAALNQIAMEGDELPCIGARDLTAPARLTDAPVTTLPLNLESFQSVRDFCDALPPGPIGTLALNAGINVPKLTQTADGIERTFQVNFLSHFLMIQLLSDRLTPNARIVLTGSGTHDAAEKTSTPPPRHADARLLADPSLDPRRDRIGGQASARAYTASKLCCILLARHWAKLHPGHSVVAFDPGFVPETGLTRDYPSWLFAIIKRIVSARMPADRTGTLETSAQGFADVVLRKSFDPAAATYVAMRGGKAVEAQPSAMARDAEVAAKLWDDSMDLIAGQL